MCLTLSHVQFTSVPDKASPPSTACQVKVSFCTRYVISRVTQRMHPVTFISNALLDASSLHFAARSLYFAVIKVNCQRNYFQAQTPVEGNRQLPDDSKANDSEILQPQPPPSTPTRARHVTSPSSVVTPRAVRNGLAKSPDATTPRRQFAQENEGLTVADGRASKTPSPDATEGGNVARSRSPRSPTSARPPSSLRVKSASEKSSPASPRTSPGTPSRTSPATPRKPSPRELRLPKLASSPTPQEASPAPENHSKITLPKLIEPSSQATRMAY